MKKNIIISTMVFSLDGLQHSSSTGIPIISCCMVLFASTTHGSMQLPTYLNAPSLLLVHAHHSISGTTTVAVVLLSSQIFGKVAIAVSVSVT